MKEVSKKAKGCFSTLATLFIYFLVLLAITLLFSNDYSSSSDYARITEVDYKAEVVDEIDSNGKVIITERLTFDVHAEDEDNPFWELWRDLPETYVDGVKVDYKVNSVKQILDDGTEIIYDESPKLYWDDSDYLSSSTDYGPGKWYHSKGPYDEDARQYECLLFYVDGLYREKVVFEIEYEMTNASLRYRDSSELYLSMYSGDTIKYLESYKAQILIPNKDMPRSGNYEAYTYGTNLHTFPFNESDTLNPGYYTFSFELDQSDLQFKSYNQYIEFALISYGEDRHIFSEYASNNDYSNDSVLDEIRYEQEKYKNLPNKYYNIKIIVFSLCLIASIIIVYYTLTKDKRIKQKYIFYKPNYDIDYSGTIPNDLDPYFAAQLIFCKKQRRLKKVHNDKYTAMLLSLIRKGYVKIENNPELPINDPNSLTIVVKYIPSNLTVNQTLIQSNTTTNDKFEPLTPTEEHYFNLIIRHAIGNRISMKDFQSKVSKDRKNTSTFALNVEREIKKIGKEQNYFQKVQYKKPMYDTRRIANSFLGFGLLFLIVINIISYNTRMDLAFGGFTILGITFIACFIYLYIISRKYILLTQFGENEYVRWRAFYNYLNSDALIKDQTLAQTTIVEKYLVYATAFGIADKIINTLKAKYPYVNSDIVHNDYYQSVHFRTHVSSVRTSAHKASYGISSGGHGGYGGGGRGGGGGGGGH